MSSNRPDPGSRKLPGPLQPAPASHVLDGPALRASDATRPTLRRRPPIGSDGISPPEGRVQLHSPAEKARDASGGGTAARSSPKGGPSHRCAPWHLWLRPSGQSSSEFGPCELSFGYGSHGEWQALNANRHETRLSLDPSFIALSPASARVDLGDRPHCCTGSQARESYRVPVRACKASRPRTALRLKKRGILTLREGRAKPASEPAFCPVGLGAAKPTA